MVVDKTDLQDSFPSSSSYTQVATGDTVTAQVENANNNAWLTLVTILYNYCIDQTPQIGEATTYTALQSFSAGLKTDAITAYTTNGDLVLSKNGTGLVKYDGTGATNEIANKAYVTAALAAAGTISLNYSYGGIQATTFTAVRGYMYPINTSGGAFTGTLPASPSEGDLVGFVDIKGTFGTYNFTIGRNGKTIMDLSEDLVMDTDYGTAYLVYSAVAGGWYLI